MIIRTVRSAGFLSAHGLDWCRLVILTLCLVAAGCRDEGVVTWKKEAGSPDSYWLASAEGKEMGGVGGSTSFTTINLIRKNDPDKEGIEIISLATDKVDINLQWTAPRHLEVVYKGNAEVNFQAVKAADVEISLRHL